MDDKTLEAFQALRRQPGITDDMLDGLVALELDACVSVCHRLALNAGWWHDLETQQKVVRPLEDTFALFHSEVSEAFEGWRKGLMDDHLPHRTMLEVELADVLIRIFDAAGGYGWPLKPRSLGLSYEGSAFFVALHSDLATAYSSEDIQELEFVISSIFSYAEENHLDVTGATIQKLAYNLSRADHKREARLAEGGKKV